MVSHHFNPGFSAIRKSNLYTALRTGPHFNVKGCFGCSSASYRCVSIVANIRSTAVKKCHCRPSRNPIPPAKRSASEIDW